MAKKFKLVFAALFSTKCIFYIIVIIINIILIRLESTKKAKFNIKKLILLIILFETALCLKTRQLPQSHSLFSIARFRKVLFDHEYLQHTFPFVQLYFSCRTYICYTLSPHLNSFNGKNGHT